MLTRSALALVLLGLFSAPPSLRAQDAGGQRKLLTVAAAADSRISTAPGVRAQGDLFGGGGRVTVSIGELTSRGIDAFDYFTFGAFYSSFPEQPPHTSNPTGQPISATHYGIELGVHFLRTPVWGVFDPFLAIGAGVISITPREGEYDPTLMLSPGIGFRIPLRSRFEMRLDGRWNSARDKGTLAGEDLEDLAQLTVGLGLAF